MLGCHVDASSIAAYRDRLGAGEPPATRAAEHTAAYEAAVPTGEPAEGPASAAAEQRHGVDLLRDSVEVPAVRAQGDVGDAVERPRLGAASASRLDDTSVGTARCVSAPVESSRRRTAMASLRWEAA